MTRSNYTIASPPEQELFISYLHIYTFMIIERIPDKYIE